MSIEFEREVQTATFHSPLEDFERVEVDVEVRTDPLTGRAARIVPESFLMPGDDPDIESVVTDDEGCFFCPGTVEEATPTYPGSIGMDRGSVGEATSFPNLNPYGAHSNVVAVTEDHYVPIDEFTTEQMRDGLAAALEYVGAVFGADDDAEFGSVNMNFLRSAGSSIIHPHMQTLVDGRGTNEQRLRAESARAYRGEAGSSYWADLLDEERGGERAVGSTGSVEWLAPFAPKHHRHVIGVADYTGVPSPDEGVVDDLADGITNLLDYYGSVGLNAFNFALSVSEGRRPVIDLIARSVFDRHYWSDSPFFVTLHDEGVVDVAPEEYAAAAGGVF